jgi:Rod binding domain-containing protein
MDATVANLAASNAYDITKAKTPAELKAREVSQEFESFFISTLLETMSSGIEVDPAFGGGQGETIFRSMLNDEYARTFAHAGGIGVADSVYREMMRLQEVQ